MEVTCYFWLFGSLLSHVLFHFTNEFFRYLYELFTYYYYYYYDDDDEDGTVGGREMGPRDVNVDVSWTTGMLFFISLFQIFI